MRETLSSRVGERGLFIGVFERFGEGSKKQGRIFTKTLCLVNVRDVTGVVFCDHVWLESTPEFEKLDLKPGDMVEFRATIGTYTKGYKGLVRKLHDRPPAIDYKLNKPRKVQKIRR